METSKFLVYYQDANYDDPFTPEQISEYTKGHIDHLRDMDSTGILFFCGLLKGDEKGMLILNAKTQEEAEGHVLRDPFIANKCYKTYLIYEIAEANAGNNFLSDT